MRSANALRGMTMLRLVDLGWRGLNEEEKKVA